MVSNCTTTNLGDDLSKIYVAQQPDTLDGIRYFLQD